MVVNLTGDSADVIVPQEYMEDAKRAQIEDIVKRENQRGGRKNCDYTIGRGTQENE